ncbi:hypothetical protein IMCC26134_15190 [Verrucomicrobia bacterium IMCC26134]|nr:hypothetical protein IMCC26134_15190 [Verrucomicrobia bacterium IMCC26134]
MNHDKIQKKLNKYHATFEPDFRRICARSGVNDTPGVCWASLVCSHGSILVAATILWDGNPPPNRSAEELLTPSPDHIVARPELVAELVARRVIFRIQAS